MKNHYQILGVQPSATAEEIRLAYKTLSKRMHPDVNFGGKIFEEIFKDINEAYQVLGDDAARFAYNQQYNHFFFATNSCAVSLPQEPTFYPAKKFSPFRRKVIKNSLVCGVLLFAFVAVNAFVFEDPAAMNGKLEVVPAPANITLYTKAADATGKEKKNAVAFALQPPRQKTSAVILPGLTLPKQEKLPNNFIVPQSAGGAEKKLTVKQQWSEAQLQALAESIKLQHAKLNHSSKYIRLIQAGNCNVSNAFQVAYYLQSAGFVIAGRETVSSPSKGLSLMATPQLVEVRLGSL